MRIKEDSQSKHVALMVFSAKSDSAHEAREGEMSSLAFFSLANRVGKNTAIGGFYPYLDV